MTLAERIAELIAQHGTLRAVSRTLAIDVGYLSRLERGLKTEASGEVLSKLGLRRVTSYERTDESGVTAVEAAQSKRQEHERQKLIEDLAYRAAYWRQPGIGECQMKDVTEDFAQELDRAVAALRTAGVQGTPEPKQKGPSE
jgi:hypothetical protein